MGPIATTYIANYSVRRQLPSKNARKANKKNNPEPSTAKPEFLDPRPWTLTSKPSYEPQELTVHVAHELVYASPFAAADHRKSARLTLVFKIRLGLGSSRFWVLGFGVEASGRGLEFIRSRGIPQELQPVPSLACRTSTCIEISTRGSNELQQRTPCPPQIFYDYTDLDSSYLQMRGCLGFMTSLTLRLGYKRTGCLRLRLNMC